MTLQSCCRIGQTCSSSNASCEKACSTNHTSLAMRCADLYVEDGVPDDEWEEASSDDNDGSPGDAGL